MEIFRVPKHPGNAAVARVTLLQAHGGRIRASLKVEGPMSGFMEEHDHETIFQAENWVIEKSEQQRASVLIIEDRS